MKKLLIILFQIYFILIYAEAQSGAIRYGVEANQFIVGSGFGTSTELQAFIFDRDGRRLSVGVYFDSKLNRIGGFSISTLRILGFNKREYTPFLQPYLFYNLIFHKTTITSYEISDTYRVVPGTYKSIEHHAGIGIRLNIIPNLYLKGEIGYGVYLGSIMKPSAPDAVTNESYGSFGGGTLIKLGMGKFF